VVRDFNDRASKDHRLRVDDLLPEPFVGDRKAMVVILGNNPGLTEERVPFKQEPVFLQRMRANLLHEPSDWPFVFFAPDINPCLRLWWERKLRMLLDLGHEVLAKSLLAVEYFPYPSRTYGGERLPRLPSQAQRYSFGLVEEAIQRRAVVVVTRGKRRWLRDVPALDGYEGLCELRSWQAGSISLRNCPRFHDVRRAIEAGTA
jgi:hypothetical protein